MKTILIVSVMAVAVLFAISCARFRNAPSESKETRYVVISPIYNEIIWALGAQDKVVGIDLSTTYPPEVKNVQTVGYHSAEGILSLHPTAIIHDNNIGSSQVVQQLQQLNIPMHTFTAKNNSFDGTKALIREMGVYFHKKRAQKNSATER
jgi:iron complex transport system substrate-binding protein